MISGNKLSAVKNAYRSYKKRSKQKGRDFEVSLEEFIHLCSKNCHYCNCRPKNKSASRKIKKQFKGYVWTYNGIDRVNPNKGYVKGNMLPCCFRCNLAKSNMGYKKFLAFIKKIYKNRIGK